MRRFFRIALFTLILAQITNAWGSGTQFVRISPTLSGPSGLLITQSADTLEPGEVDVGVGLSHQRSGAPDVTLDEAAPTLTVGLPWDIELSAHGPYLRAKTPASKEGGFEDADLTVKWRFMEANEEYNLPAFGISLSYLAPTGNKKLELVDSWGLKALIVSSAEVMLGGSSYGIPAGFYADGGVFLRDLNKPTEEKHGLIDLGALFPLTPSNALQLMIEGSGTFKDQIPLEGNYLALSGGLRYVASHLSLSAGVQRRLAQDKGVSDSNRFLFQTSLLF